MIEVVYDGYALPSAGPVLSSMWAFNRGLEADAFRPRRGASASRRRRLAGQRTATACWIATASDLSFELLAPSESETRQDVALMIERDLARIGVRVTPRFIEWGALQAAMAGGDFDAIVNRWVEPTQVDLWGVWHSSPPGEPTFNFGGYDNPEVDRLLEAVDEAPDFATQKPLLDEIQTLIVADQPYLFLVENTRLVGHNIEDPRAPISMRPRFSSTSANGRSPP